MPGWKKKTDDLLKRYSKVRKPMPPPERVEPDHRQEIEEKQAEREAEEELNEQ